MSRIELMLRDKIGLDATSIGSSLIQRTVRLRMKCLGLKSPDQYEAVLARSQTEWDELVESVVVTETWFFRDQEPFSAFIRLLLAEWFPAHPASQLRVLSLPCSSGEEPYSLVMTLLDAGIPPERFEIHAIDISHRIIARAKRGVYTRNSFRVKDLDFRERYFQTTKDGFLLNPAIRSLVRFSRGNILSQDFLADKGTFDFVFCRNLLIYFDRPTQKQALERIANLLMSSGVLFVGPAEQPLVMEHGFVSANIPMAFACRKAVPRRDASPHASRKLSGTPASLPAHLDGPTEYSPPSSVPDPIERAQTSGSLPPSKLPAKVSPITFHASHVTHQAPNLTPTQLESATAIPDDLQHARRLADAGRLAEAAAICDAHLRKTRDSAQAYYLLGLIRDAGGVATAEECYRKALYLKPDHYETLLQMALLAEKEGDASRARAYKRRAERVKLESNG